ncbi:arginyltransferase [Phytohalomonas tamaricis]|uniref:arginyltransferase n=1 Tax=Phytohalomonas tamaricis TaxID=2081032 RepID=UPI000D0BC354|nr:arginyltransferase [Phytohalomonas tamaricis]
MSDHPLTPSARDLRFFLTVPHVCSYLKDREATTLFLDPHELPSDEVYSALTLLGFRRSGGHLYRPHCGDCRACISVRIPVEDFKPNRTQRRILRRNSDLEVIEKPAVFDEEHYALYSRYINQRHRNGDMYPPSQEQYQAFLTSNEGYTRLIEFRLEGELIIVAAVDTLSHGLSAIYTFFDPDERWQTRSLGSYAILWQIEHARIHDLPYVYLGYWIRTCQKMRYKQNFQPLEYLDGRLWRRAMPEHA